MSDIKFYYYNEMADYSMKDNNYLMAIDYYNKMIDINDTIYEIYFNKGAALIKLKDYDNALKTFEQAKQLNSNDCELYYNCGLIYQAIGEVGMSNLMLEKSVEIDPDYYMAYANLGENYLSEKDKEASLAYFTKYLEYVPDDLDILQIINELANE